MNAVRPAARRWWLEALARGAIAFILVLALGEALALAVWAFGETGVSLADALAAGWLEVGAFHHVAVRVDVRDLVTPAASSIHVTIGVALLAVTLAAGWLVSHAGRAIADAVGGAAWRRVLAAAIVGVGYAIPFAVVAPFIAVESAPPSDATANGVFRLSLVSWQAIVFPLVLGVVAAGVGGLRSALATRAPDARGDRLAAAAAGARRALVAAGALSFLGLFVGGVVEPDGPIALATPTTARYVRAVFERPALGLVLLGHHVALAPAEATWVLAASMGACDRVTGSVDADLLCYARFPERLVSTETPISSTASVRLPIGQASFGDAPAAYLLFLLVPAGATVLGGIRASASTDDRREAVRRAALAGVGFALAVVALAALSNVTVGYRWSVAGDVTRGWLALGPEPLRTGALALAWGVGGGAVGAVVSSGRWPSRSRAGTRGTAPR